jgi:putative transposase
MPRKVLIRNNEYPYHVTMRVNNREEFPCGMDYAWKVLTDELHCRDIVAGSKTHAFVLMPNHFHLLITTPDQTLDKIMQVFGEATTRIINTKCRRHGHLYSGRYYWSLITNHSYYFHALKYVYRNPSKAGLAEVAENYPYSTLYGVSGNGQLPLRLHPARESFETVIPAINERLLGWLNEAYHPKDSEAIRRALKNKKFKIAKRFSERRATVLCRLLPETNRQKL